MTSDEDMKNKIKCWWIILREASRVLCSIAYKILKQGTSVTEMRMLLWMCKANREEIISNEYIKIYEEM